MKLERGKRVKHPDFKGIALFVDEVHDDGMATVIMVGDDMKHVVHGEDLSKLKRSEFCSECGQIGCSWG